MESPNTITPIAARPTFLRRPTDHELALRPHLTRKPSDLLPPPMHQGQFTPEVSPLDAFISRGRQLYRQLEKEDRERNLSEHPTLNFDHNQRLEAPVIPNFTRSHSAGAAVLVGAESLNSAVEDWSIGQSTGINGQNRATKLFNHGPLSQPFQRQASPSAIPYHSIAPHTASTRPLSPLRAQLPQSNSGLSQGLTIQEPSFRPVSQHPRISGFDFGERDATPSAYARTEHRTPSGTRSGLSSPKSPRMPFAATDDDSSDDEESFSRIQGVRRDLSRGRGPQIFLPRQQNEHSPVSSNDDYRRSLEDQISPRHMQQEKEFALPEQKYPQRSDSRNSSIFDAVHGGDEITNLGQTTKTNTRRPLTPPKSASPIEAGDRSHLPKRQSSLQAPVLPIATISTPNLVSLSHHPNLSFTSLNDRKFSDSSNAVTRNELFLPPQPAFAARSAPNSPRPTSAMSDTASIYSMGGTKKVYNFSRPASQMGGEMPPQLQRLNSDLARSRLHENYSPTSSEGQDIAAGYNQRTSNEEEAHVQGAVIGQVDLLDNYTYTQFTLPRGREVHRESVMFFDGEKRRFVYDSQRQSLQRQDSNDSNKSADMMQAGKKAASFPLAIMRSSSESHERESSRDKTPSPRRHHQASASISGSPNVKRPSTSGAQRLTPQEHLDLGISLHEKGSNAESTYHFRLSAHGGNPSGMLMYGLALRHGWGMKQNPTEAVSWLRKAADIVQRDIAIAEADGTNKQNDLVASKEMKTKLALAVYELGMSCSNGWGVPVDKTLALQYFELAASWGDSDALSEAGFAYANGQGCKKDLKKSATYYRAAAAKGVSMVGNSWIWKDKYSTDDDNNFATPAVENKEKEKESGPRGLFGRKKSAW